MKPGPIEAAISGLIIASTGSPGARLMMTYTTSVMPSSTGTLIASRRSRYLPMIQVAIGAVAGRASAGHRPLVGIPHVVRGVARRLEPDQLLAHREDRVRRPEAEPRQLVVHDLRRLGVDLLPLVLVRRGAAQREQLVQPGVGVVAIVAADRHPVDRLHVLTGDVRILPEDATANLDKVEVASVSPTRSLGAVRRDDLHVDADILELLLQDRHVGVALLGAAGRVQALEGVAAVPTAVLQQLLRLVRIEVVVVELRDPHPLRPDDRLADQLRLALHDRLDHRLTVDGVIHPLPD